MSEVELKTTNPDPPTILPSYIVADESGKLYYDGHLVIYAWYSQKQNRNHSMIAHEPFKCQRLLANSEKHIWVTQVGDNPTACTWSDRHFVGYVYDNKF